MPHGARIRVSAGHRRVVTKAPCSAMRRT
jgi:hypothetical protein